jgi:hypothetical protein
MTLPTVMTYATHPLVLVGFVLLLMFGLHRLLVRSGLLPPVQPHESSGIIKQILRYGFVIALSIMVLGFGLAGLIVYRESQPPQQYTQEKTSWLYADENHAHLPYPLFDMAMEEGKIQLTFVPKQLYNVSVCDDTRPSPITLTAPTYAEVLKQYAMHLYPHCFSWKEVNIHVTIETNTEHNSLLTKRETAEGVENFFCNCSDEVIEHIISKTPYRFDHKL